MRRILTLWAMVVTWLSGSALARPVEAQSLPTCAACREPITSTYIQYGRQLYHPQHFTCAACQRPIGNKGYVPYQGKPYHQACYAEAFAERCGVCEKPLVGRYIQKDGQSYHEACYQQALAEKCSVCLQGITGQYFKDAWGNVYHAAHQRQAPTCEYCSRIITPRTSSGGYTYNDGRSVCGLCHRTQVSGDVIAQPIVESVRDRMAEWGLVVPKEAAPVILVDRATLRKLLRRTGHPGGPNVNGFTSVLTEKRGNQIVKREMAVYVLFGMPREIFEGTVAHELTHVWINLNNGRRLDPAFEEGSCNYMKYLIHANSESELASYAIKAMQQDQDPAYGAGFRRVKNLVDRRGLEELYALLGRSTGFPLGY